MKSEARATLLERVGRDLELLRDLVALSTEDAPRQLAAIRKAISVGDAKALSEAAHTLTGTASYFEAGAATDLALRLARMGRAGSLEGATELCDALAQAIEDLHAGLSRFCEELEAPL